MQCKKNYFDEIFPADNTKKQTKGHIILKDIALRYFAENKYDELERFFMEGQYLIDLWAAHLILEYGSPTESLKQKCLVKINNYSESTLNPKIAVQETDWLKNYFNKK